MLLVGALLAVEAVEEQTDLPLPTKPRARSQNMVFIVS